MSSPESEHYNLLDRLAEEFAARYRRGERPALQEYTERYPELTEEIRELFPAMVKVEQAEGVRHGREPNGDSPASNPPMSEVGDYRMLREIGRGGMGVVYEAEQISLGRRVALKVLPRQASGDPMVRERFRREARAAARLHHTNIVPVYEVGQDRDVRFYAMQFIQGQGLDQVIDELRRLRDRSGRDPGIRSSVEGRPPQPGGEVEASAAVRSILAGRFDPRGRPPVPAESSRLTLTANRAASVATQPDTGTDPRPAGSNSAPERTEVDVALAGDRNGPERTHPSAHGPSSARRPSSGSAILPGGTQLSSIESGGHAFFRSLAHIGRQVAGGLAYAHARGIVHRDIKPSNLLLDGEGVVWITDFGLAKGDDEGLTHTGDILGTLRYMAPERFRGESDARSDVYALGMTLYELLALRSGFRSSDRLELIEQIKTEEPPRPRSVDARIPRDLETIVLKAIEKDPKARYPSADAMGEDLGRFLADQPIKARQVGPSERFWRWARRNKGIAALLGVLIGVLMLATLISLVAMEQFRIQARTQRALAGSRESARQGAVLARAEEADARHKADEANASLRATQQVLHRTVYATRSNLALAAWDAADVGRLRSLLDLLRPAPGEPDLRGWEWRYLWQLAHDDRLTLPARDDGFVDVAFSPDGGTLAGLEWQGRIQLWDRRTGRSLGMTGAPQGRRADLAGGVSALRFSPDGRTLAGPGPDSSLALYDVATRRLTLRFGGPAEAVQQMAWSPDGRTLVAGLSKHIMRVWDARDGHIIHEAFGGHRGPVAAVAFSPDGRTIASAGYDRRVKLWNPEDGVHPRAVLEGHADEVRAVAFSPDGRRIASAGLDRTIRVWDARSGAGLAVLQGHTGWVLSLAFGPGGATIVTGSADETVRVWDTDSGRELRTFKGHTDEVDAVAISRDGRDLASASKDRTVRIWDVANPPRPRTLHSPSVLTYGGSVECLAFSPDGRRLVSGHDDRAIRVWDLATGEAPVPIKGHTRRIMCVAFSPDGRAIASGAADNSVRLWDAATGRPRIIFAGHTAEIGGLAFTPDGRTVLSAGYDRTIRAWDPATGAVRYVLRGHSGEVHDLALGPDGLTLASVGSDRTCILWDLPGRRPRVTLRGHTDVVNRVAFSPDGLTLATSSNDDTIRLWDAADGSPRGILRGHTEAVYGLAFSPDGRLASSGLDKTIRLWDPASGQTLLILKGHAALIRCLNYSPDGRTLASASHDRTIKLWEAATPAALARP